jgi:hypothetical protein
METRSPRRDMLWAFLPWFSQGNTGSDPISLEAGSPRTTDQCLFPSHDFMRLGNRSYLPLVASTIRSSML